MEKISGKLTGEGYVNQEDHEYDDIIDLPNPTSQNHRRMSLYDRAAQFSPFAALTGHDEAIKETARLTEERIELDEDTFRHLNERLNRIRENIFREQVVAITYFVPDEKKMGGMYTTHVGVVKRIDEYNRVLMMADKTAIPIEQIQEIEMNCIVREEES